MKRAVLIFLILVLAGTLASFLYKGSLRQPAQVSNGPVSENPQNNSSSTATSTQTVDPSEKIVISNPTPSQGDILVVDVPSELQISSATLGGQEMEVFDYGRGERAIYPISATKKTGSYALSIKFKEGETFIKTITVRSGEFKVVSMPGEGTVDPQEVLDKMAADSKDFNSTFDMPSGPAQFSGPFIIPLKNYELNENNYGEVRKTGEVDIRHLGTDLGAAEGEPVYAMNDGIVAKTRTYLAYGNTIIVNHGAGMFSIYLHLSKINVKQGDKVNKGELIGNVGNTGYSTAPHLHLSFKINKVSVNPIKFLQNFK